MRNSARLALAFVLLLTMNAARADDPPLAEYFRVETARIAATPLMGIDSAEAWKAKRPELQRQLKAMLGLWPEPQRGDLKVEVRRTVERPDFVIENVLYQSLPGLYVTANVYRPKKIDKPLPAILYVCGHSDIKKDGVIYGCKAHYQHHAAWFAANGYVCLIVDTLQLGEVPGLHHGTYREGMWWWQSRGYTPAGVEAWNATRGIDYLVSRPDVDSSKIGVTGRSGGGATSWWVGAIDDRVAAVCPVAGITDLRNHVVDGVIEGHCDCMYFVNTERWDFPMVAALVAPKPLLIENTDKDPIFPEDGVRRIYAQAEKVYEWYDAKDRLSLIIGKGGHVDSVELRHPAFAFFEKYLKGKLDAKIEEPDRTVPIEDLKVLKVGEVLTDGRNATIHETFVPKFSPPAVPKTKEAWDGLKAKWMETLRTQVVRGWPDDEEAGPLRAKLVEEKTRDKVRMKTYEFLSQSGVPLRLWVFTPIDAGPPTRLMVFAYDENGWRDHGSLMIRALSGDPNDPKTPRHIRSYESKSKSFRTETFAEPDAKSSREHRGLPFQKGDILVLLAPRGVGPNAWPVAKETHLRRRFALLGQTLHGMRAYDVRRAIAATREIEDLKGAKTIHLHGRFEAAPVAALAAALEPAVSTVSLADSPVSAEVGPVFLNFSRTLDVPQLASIITPRKITISPRDDSAWAWAKTLGENLGFEPLWHPLLRGAPAEPPQGGGKRP